MKIVINRGNRTFKLSEKAYNFLGIDWDGFGYKYDEHDINVRTDPKLIECIETLGLDASGDGAHIVVLNIPDDKKVYIDFDSWEYCTTEKVVEEHDEWY